MLYLHWIKFIDHTNYLCFYNFSPTSVGEMATLSLLVFIVAILFSCNIIISQRKKLYENKTIDDWFHGVYRKAFRIQNDRLYSRLNYLQKISCIIKKSDHPRYIWFRIINSFNRLIIFIFFFCFCHVVILAVMMIMAHTDFFVSQIYINLFEQLTLLKIRHFPIGLSMFHWE